MDEIERLITALNDPDRNVRLHAIVELGKARDLRAVEPLIATLRDPDREVRRLAAAILGELGDPRTIEPLLAMLRDPNIANALRTTISKAILRVAELQFRAPRAIEPLAAALNDPDKTVHQFAATTLGELGDLRAIRPLFAMLRDPDTANIPRMATIKAIWKALVMSPAAWPILVVIVGMILGWIGGATHVGLGGIISGAIVGTFLGVSEGMYGNRGAVGRAINGALLALFAVQPDVWRTIFAEVLVPLIITAIIGWIGIALIGRASKVMSKTVVSLVVVCIMSTAVAIALFAALIVLTFAKSHVAILMAILQQPSGPVAVAAGLAIIFAMTAVINEDKKLAARPTSVRLFETLAGASFGAIGAALGLAIFMAIRG